MSLQMQEEEEEEDWGSTFVLRSSPHHWPARPGPGPGTALRCAMLPSEQKGKISTFTLLDSSPNKDTVHCTILFVQSPIILSTALRYA